MQLAERFDPVRACITSAVVLVAMVTSGCPRERWRPEAPVIENVRLATSPEPRAWFRFEDVSGDVIDSRSSARGTAIDIERGVPGRVGRAGRFPASEARAAYVRVKKPASMATWTQLSVSVWVFLEDHGGFNLVGDYGGPGADAFIFGMHGQVLNVSLGLYPSCDGMTTWTDRSGALLPIGRWTHVAFTLDLAAHRVEFYIDGRKTFGDDIYETNQRFCDRGSPLLIGPFMNQGTHPYSAKIDELKIFDVTLDAKQVRAEAISD